MNRFQNSKLQNYTFKCSIAFHSSFILLEDIPIDLMIYTENFYKENYK